MINEMTGRNQRRRFGLSAAVLVAVVALAAGCAQGNTPTGYDEVTRQNFIDGCTGKGTDVPAADEQTCGCAYDWIAQNVPFDSNTRASTGDYSGPDFIELDKTLRSEPEKFPEEITNALREACPNWGSSDSASDRTETTEPVGPVTPETTV